MIPMWAPATVVFLLWIAYGIYQWRNGPRLLAKLRQIKAASRRLWGTTLLVASAAFLLGSLYGLSNVSPAKEGLTIGQWVAVAIIGLIFVHGQTMACAMLLSLGDLGVSNAQSSASSLREPEK
jgi:hypothetical protein